MLPKNVGESTVSAKQATGDAAVLEKVARRAFTCGRVSLSVGETCLLIRSARFPSRFYVVVWDEGALCWLCSCGAGSRDHAHTRKAGQHARTKLQEEAKVAWKRQKEAESASWQSSHKAAQEIAHMRA